MTQDPTITRAPLWRYGDQDQRLAVLREHLRKAGYDVEPAGDPSVFDRSFDLAVRQFQQRRGLLVDGELGRQTLLHLEFSRYRLGDRVLRFDPVRFVRGDDVAELQTTLRSFGVYTSIVDSVYGPGTDAALRELQRDLGQQPDGACGPETLRAIAKIRRDLGGGNPHALNESAKIRRSGPSLVGKTIVIEADTIDPADPNTPNTPAADVARRLEGRLTAVGCTSIVLSGRTHDPRLPDHVGSDAVVAIGTDALDNSEASGLSTFYYGKSPESPDASPLGSRLATLIHRELLSRTDMQDLRTHPRTWESLRQLYTPKVQVVLGYRTNRGDQARLSNPGFRDAVAEGLLAAIQRLYMPDANTETGTISITDVLRQGSDSAKP